MTERTALGLVYAVSAILITAWMLGLGVAGAPNEVIVIGPMFVLIGGATAVARVTIHYAPSHREHDDE